MAKDPAFLFYSSDFLTGVSFFTNEETGLYIKMLCYQHQHGGMIPKKFFDDAIALLPNIKSKFIECEDGYFNERLMEEMEKRIKKSKTLSDNSLIRWKKHKKCKCNANGYANAMQTEDEDEDEIRDRIKDKDLIKEGMQGGKPNWKTSFETYKQESQAALKEILSDVEWLSGRIKYHPNLNIKLSLEKAWGDYWLTEAGWKNKKSKKTLEIDWKRTAVNALSQKCNQVWIPKEQKRTAPDGTEIERMSEEEFNRRFPDAK